MDESGWENSTPAPGRSLTGGHRGGRRSSSSGHRGDYSDARDRTDGPSAPGRRAAYQLQNAELPHRTPSPVHRPAPGGGRRAAYPVVDDWDDDAEADLPLAPPASPTEYGSGDTHTGSFQQPFSYALDEPDDEDDLPTSPQPTASAPIVPSLADEVAPAPAEHEQYEPEPILEGWPPDLAAETQAEPTGSYLPEAYLPPVPEPVPPTYERYEPEPAQPLDTWAPTTWESDPSWTADELSDQTETSLFAAQPYVDHHADLLPVTDGYADELLGSDALGPGALPTDPETSPSFPNDILDHATELRGPVDRWEPVPPPRPQAERPLFDDDPYTVPQRMAQREERYERPQPAADLPPVQLAPAPQGRRPERAEQRKPKATGMSGRLAILIGFSATLATAGLDLLLTNRLGIFFVLSFVLTAFGIAAAVRRPDVFTAAVLPPLGALGTFAVLGVLAPERLAGYESPLPAVLSTLADQSWTLVAATGLALGTVAIRVAISRPSKQNAPAEEPARRDAYSTY